MLLIQLEPLSVRIVDPRTLLRVDSSVLVAKIIILKNLFEEPFNITGKLHHYYTPTYTHIAGSLVNNLRSFTGSLLY